MNDDPRVLRDAVGDPTRWTVVLDFDDSELGPDGTWRVTRVDLLAMVPEWVFDQYEGGDVIRVDIWDAEQPDGPTGALRCGSHACARACGRGMAIPWHLKPSACARVLRLGQSLGVLISGSGQTIKKIPEHVSSGRQLHST